MPYADQGDDRGGFHEIEMSAEAAEQRPNAIDEGGGGTERDQGVHVRVSDLQLVPCAAVEGGAGDGLDDTRQREGTPLEPRRHAEPESPFADHQWQGAEDADPQIQFPPPQPGFAAPAPAGFEHLRSVTLRFNRLNHGRNVLRRICRPSHQGLVGLETDHRTPDSGNVLDRPGDVPGAIGAGHARDGQFSDGLVCRPFGPPLVQVQCWFSRHCWSPAYTSEAQNPVTGLF